MRLFHTEGALANPVALLPDPHPDFCGRGILRALTGQKTRPAGRVFRYREGSPWNINENTVQMEVEWRWQMSN
jgi:hypothetical protein